MNRSGHVMHDRAKILKKSFPASLSSIRLNQPRAKLRLSRAVTFNWWHSRLLQFSWKGEYDLAFQMGSSTRLWVETA
ncbi:hypothetical protein R1flu_002549 [Riccia fluitans]|uniref:Uncharacterized protein n=1 Tax=Riccia fluitans TaxID=41844 RepID=A0ABD1Y7F7_9MARC